MNFDDDILGHSNSKFAPVSLSIVEFFISFLALSPKTGIITPAGILIALLKLIVQLVSVSCDVIASRNSRLPPMYFYSLTCQRINVKIAEVALKNDHLPLFAKLQT